MKRKYSILLNLDKEKDIFTTAYRCKFGTFIKAYYILHSEFFEDLAYHLRTKYDLR